VTRPEAPAKLPDPLFARIVMASKAWPLLPLQVQSYLLYLIAEHREAPWFLDALDNTVTGNLSLQGQPPEDPGELWFGGSPEVGVMYTRGRWCAWWVWRFPFGHITLPWKTEGEA
jgi:hypothetical protein